MKKLVSVIIPTHKGSQYIVDAVESVLNQTYSNIEIIVVDDNGLGTDEQIKTKNKLAEYIECRKIKYIPHYVNKNGSAARNTGFKNSTGDYVCLLDDDDEYYPDKVEKEANTLEKLSKEWGMVFCSGEGSSKKAKSGNILFELLIHSVVIGSNSFMIRREIWDRLSGFDESFKRHQDYEFTARVASICKIKYIPFVGFKSKETNRNIPKNINQAQEYRTHYLDMMMTLIHTLPMVKQKIVICCNAMEVTSNGNLLKNNELMQYASQWSPKFSMATVLYVCIMKTFRKIKWYLFQMKR